MCFTFTHIHFHLPFSTFITLHSTSHFHSHFIFIHYIYIWFLFWDHFIGSTKSSNRIWTFVTDRESTCMAIPFHDVFMFLDFCVAAQAQEMPSPSKSKGKMKYQFDKELAHATPSLVASILWQHVGQKDLSCGHGWFSPKTRNSCWPWDEAHQKKSHSLCVSISYGCHETWFCSWICKTFQPIIEDDQGCWWQGYH